MLDKTWYKDAIFYNVHVRSFFDSDDNGIGDIEGLRGKLDYLEDLGINCISLLPFYDSPLKDDGYDVSDYTKVHRDCGSIEDFQHFLDDAHRRGIRVVIDFIINHTSTQHGWFKRAVKAPKDSPERNYYVWSDTQDRYSEASILFTDYETSNWAWDNDAKAYYWHRFYSSMADLNFDNPRVHEEVLRIIDFWASMGVDGFRLMSLPYIYQREGTNCENLPEVHVFLRKLRKYLDEQHEGCVLIAETNMWPEDAASYFGAGNECHMNYHFPLMPRLFMALQTEDRYPIIDIIEQTPDIPDNSQWAMFLRNHDDLTLTMVTEEERDYLYKVLAKDTGSKINEGIRRRLAPLLGNDRRKIELLNTLLFSLPGSPVIYYGDEIGMGDNIYLGDRNGIRTPMQWNSDRNAGFSQCNPQRLFLPIIRDPQYRYESVNVEMQQRNPSSLLWWMKNIIAIRKRYKAFSRGSLQFLRGNNSKVLTYIRSYGEQNILVIANLSKYSQALELDLRRHVGTTPVEIFSQSKFFPIDEGSSYPFVIGPYGYYWLLLENSEAEHVESKETALASIEVDVDWAAMFDTFSAKSKFEKQVLPNYLNAMRWFGGKSKSLVAINVARYPFIPLDGSPVYFLNIVVRYTDGLPETYFLPTAFITNGKDIQRFLEQQPKAVICYLNTPSHHGILVDAIYLPSFRIELFHNMQTRQRFAEGKNELLFGPGKILSTLPVGREHISGEVLNAEQSNTSVIYNDAFFFKIYRKLDTDINPDLELVRFLSEKTDFANSPRYGGGIEYVDKKAETFTILGLLQNKIPNQGDAWVATQESLRSYYEQVLAKAKRSEEAPKLITLPRLYFEDLPELHRRLISSVTYERVCLLARRTAEMHIALASDLSDESFKPEPFTQNYQRSIYSGHRKLVNEKLSALQERMKALPPHIAVEAQKILDLQDDIMACFSEISGRKIRATKIRVHGDYHLGQVLFDGKDYFIIDFEGEPLHSLSERRLKKTPFKDVAGMIRSFHYAAYGQLVLNQNYRKEDMPFLEQWALQWYHYVRQFYLTAYLDVAEGHSFVPIEKGAQDLLLRNYTLEKAIYEVGYEMNSRPEWLRVPIRGVLHEMAAYSAEKD